MNCILLLSSNTLSKWNICVILFIIFLQRWIRMEGFLSWERKSPFFWLWPFCWRVPSLKIITNIPFFCNAAFLVRNFIFLTMLTLFFSADPVPLYLSWPTSAPATSDSSLASLVRLIRLSFLVIQENLWHGLPCKIEEYHHLNFESWLKVNGSKTYFYAFVTQKNVCMPSIGMNTTGNHLRKNHFTNSLKWGSELPDLSLMQNNMITRLISHNSERACWIMRCWSPT